jgi:guanylate cyclase
MEELGVDFVYFVGKFGYDKILRVLGRHMRDFLNGLDNLHEYMRFSYSKLKPPSFFVENESATGLILHYRSKRKGFRYYVRGQIREVGKVFYNLDVKIDVLSENQENDLVHVIYKLNFKNDQYNQAISTSNLSTSSKSSLIKTNLNVKSETFFDLFPFHLVFKRNLEIISIGEGLGQAMKHVEGESIKDLFNLVRPLVNFTWENV